MKRIEFLRNITLLGTGIGLTPWKLLAASSSTKVYRLPKPTVHIPHGNFASVEMEKTIISELNLECTVQQFLRNGIEQSEDDLTIYSFQRGEEVLNIGITRGGTSFSHGHIPNCDLKLVSNLGGSKPLKMKIDYKFSHLNIIQSTVYLC